VSLWELPTLKKIYSLPARGSVADLAFSADASKLAVARNKQPPLRSQAIKNAEEKSFAVDPVGANLVEVHRHSQGRLQAKPEKLLAHRSIVSSVAWIGSDLLSGSWDRSVQLWNTIPRSHPVQPRHYKHIVRDLAVGPGGVFAVASWAASQDHPAISVSRLLY